MHMCCRGMDVPLSVNASIVAVLLSQSNCVSREHCSRFGVDNLQISIGHIHNFNKTQLYANNCRGGITKKTGFLSLSLVPQTSLLAQLDYRRA